MNSNNQSSVIIVDDDAEFVEMLCQILQHDGDNWNITHTFSSVEDFNQTLPLELEKAQEFLPDLLIIDLFSSKTTHVHSSIITGVHIALALKGMGLTFGTMIVSSLDSPTLLDSLKSEYPTGWSYVVKSTNLTQTQILNAAREALVR